jgi:uncharacterized protein (TIGR03437 family)
VNEAYGKLPLSFEANQGQVDARVKFMARGDGYSLFLTANEAVLALRSSVLRMKLAGAHPTPQIKGLDKLPGKSNYFIGRDPRRWRANVPTYSRVRYRNAYPGIDLIYYGNQRRLEYDFVIAPGADPRMIRLAFEGAQRMGVDKGGDLVLQTNVGEIRQLKPVVYQEVNGKREIIAGRYVIKGKHKVGFELGAYDKNRPVVIDPVLHYSTFLGGSSSEEGIGIAVDAAGNAYVTGSTVSTDFPRSNALQPTFGGGDCGFGTPLPCPDAFVTKLNAGGTVLLYSTYLGGNGGESGLDIAVDASGQAYVTGVTNSANFPITAGAVQPTFGGGTCFIQPCSDAFVVRLNAAGTGLVYSTYLGGNRQESGNGLAVDTSGNVYVTGVTSSRDFPVTPGAFQTLRDGFPTPTGFSEVISDVFITKLNAAGNAFVYSTFLGGDSSDAGSDIAIDSAGNVYVTGNTSSSNFPTTPGALGTTPKGNFSIQDAFVSKLNAAGTSLIYSTYLGSVDRENGSGIAVDGAGNAYVTGTTSSTDFPVTTSAFQPTYGRSFFFKSANGGNNWSPSESGLTGSTFSAIAIDPTNPAIIYTGGSAGVYRSANGGAGWSFLRGTTTAISSLAIDPRTPSTIYAGSSFGGVFRSADSGSSWNNSNSGLTNSSITSLAIDPQNPAIIYAGTRYNSLTQLGGVYKSADGGANWSPVNSGLTVVINGVTFIASISDLAIDPSNPNIIYAGSDFNFNSVNNRANDIRDGLGGVYKSTDGGSNWVPISTGLTSASGTQTVFLNINTLAVDPATPTTLYAGANGGVYKSVNGGGSWDAFNNGFPSFLSVRDIVIDPKTPATLYAGTSNGVYKSTDSGGSWSAINSGLSNLAVQALAVDPANPAVGYAGNFGGSDAYVAKLNANGSALSYSTYLRGSDFSNSGQGIALNSAGNAYVFGNTSSMDFPATPNPFPLSIFSIGGFVAKLDLSASGAASLLYSTLFGGGFFTRDFALDPSSNVYLTGTAFFGFLTTPCAFQTTNTGNDAFVVKLADTADLTADLAITQSAPQGAVVTGSDITYSFIVTNNGPSDATSVAVIDNLPDTTTFVSCAATGGGVCAGSGNNRTVNFSSLAVGASATVTLVAKANCSLADGSNISNTVVVCSGRPEPNPVDNTIAINTGVSNPQPVIACPANIVTSVAPGQSTAAVNYPAPQVSDNCPGATVVFSPPSGSNFPLGVTTVNASVTDSGGATANCTFTVTVNNTGAPQARLDKQRIEFPPIAAGREPMANPPSEVFTIENVGSAALDLVFASLLRTGGDVSNRRITEADDRALYPLRVINPGGSETPVSFGSTLSIPAGQRLSFRAQFNPLIPILAGRTTELFANQVIPDVITSQLMITPNAGAPLVVDFTGRVSTPAKMIHPADSRLDPLVVFTRAGDEFTVECSTHDSNLDLQLARYQFLDQSDRPVGASVEVGLAQPIARRNLARGQSFSIIQKFSGASQRPEINKVRVTLLDGETAVTAAPAVLGATEPALASVSAASFMATALAGESMVSSFGGGLAPGVQAAMVTPLPTSLAGVTVRVRDGAGAERASPLFFVSPGQINFQIPAGTMVGAATVTVVRENRAVARGGAQVTNASPGLFAANANGQGAAAAVALRVRAGGAQQFEPVAQFDPAQNRFITRPLDLGPPGDQLYLALFGTGIRFRRSSTPAIVRIGGIEAEALYAGAQGGFVGLDQVNALVPRSLAGRGEVDVTVIVDGRTSNPVRVRFGGSTASVAAAQVGGAADRSVGRRAVSDKTTTAVLLPTLKLPPPDRAAQAQRRGDIRRSGKTREK